MRAAVVQLRSTPDVAANLERAAYWIERAVSAGAELVALPENFAWMQEEGAGAAPAEALDGPIVTFLRERARRHGIVLVGGTFPERGSAEGRHRNTCVAVDRDGSIRGVYRKIHLFDVDLPGAMLRESARVEPGEELVVAKTAAGAIGLSVCYDLRFPELYRALVDRGAEILAVPSAFTVPTGRDHWEVLLRARAIENQCFVLAPAQWGAHTPRRRSWGRSAIVDPWGIVLCTVPDGEGIGLAEIDLEALRRVRRELPALAHRRLR